MLKHNARSVLCLLGVMLCAGCAQIDVSQSIPWQFGGEDKPGVPIKVVAVWADTVLRHVDRPAVRGFAARLMFYGEANDKPIKIDGSLVVYAFDEKGRRPEDTKPDRKFVFTHEQLAKHYSKSRLGHSYSVWIPWDELGGSRKEISLIVRFAPREGGVVIGEQAKQILPGRKPAAALVETDSPNPVGQAAPASGQLPVQAASYHQEISPAMPDQTPNQVENRQRRRMTTHTISVSPRSGGYELPSATMRPRPAAREAFVGQAGGQESQEAAQTHNSSSQQRLVPPQEARFFSVRPRLPGQSLSRVIRGGPWQQEPAAATNSQ